MPGAGPPYSPEFRAEAVRRLRSGGATVAELARELGVSEPTLRRWRLQAGDGRGEAEGPAVDEPARPQEPESGSDEGGVRRRLHLSPPGKGRPAAMLVRLAADAIEVGVAVVTAPARWAAAGLRRYADRKDEAPRRGA
jgi:transposase-like protein